MDTSGMPEYEAGKRVRLTSVLVVTLGKLITIDGKPGVVVGAYRQGGGAMRVRLVKLSEPGRVIVCSAWEYAD